MTTAGSEGDAVVGPEYKSFPPALWGTAVARIGSDNGQGSHPTTLGDFSTPLLTLDRSIVDHNIAVLAGWARESGVLLAPHGKTTMAPALWKKQIEAGAWGITLATAWQAQVARSHGMERILIANEVLAPAALRWLAHELDTERPVEIVCWADSVRAVDAMRATVGDAPRARPIRVLVELGGHGGRTGARSLDDAVDVARAITVAPGLQLAGCGGYEGALAHDRSDAARETVERYLADLAELHARLEAMGAYLPLRNDGVAPIVTAGGSAYFDVVAAALAPLAADSTEVILRCGATIVHDDGFYRGISPLDAARFPSGLESAMHAWVTVVSRPEPQLVIFDGGKRDMSFDEGMPVAQRVRGVAPEISDSWLARSSVTKLNDQHGFLLVDDEVVGRAGVDWAGVLPVGSVIRLGLSHPCTALDKWRLIPVVDDSNAVEPELVGAVETYF